MLNSRIPAFLASIMALMILSPVASAEPCEEARQAVEDCKKKGEETLSTYEAENAAAETKYSGDSNTQALGLILTQINEKCAGGMAGAAAFCLQQRSNCSNRCPTPQYQNIVDNCKKALQEQATKFNTQNISCAKGAVDAGKVVDATKGGPPPPTTDTGGQPENPGGPQAGGSDSLMPMLAGAALGGLAGYMLGKDDDKDKDKPKAKPAPPEEGETPREPADCSVAGAEDDSACNATFESACAFDSSSEQCQKFIARYCIADTSATNTDQVQPASSKGEGAETQFCKTELFCTDSTRNNCITCIERARKKSTTCAKDPASCMAQYSQSEIDQAKASCPVDPKFSDPNFAATNPGGADLPTVVLPQSANLGPAPDIGGQYGQSVFALSSGTFKKMCEEKRLKNCP